MGININVNINHIKFGHNRGDFVFGTIYVDLCVNLSDKNGSNVYQGTKTGLGTKLPK